MREQGEFKKTKKRKTRKERSENFNTLINLQFPPSLPQSSPKCPLSPISEGGGLEGERQHPKNEEFHSRRYPPISPIHTFA